MSCVIAGCRSRSSGNRQEQNDALISFHRFPVNNTLKQKWIKAVGRKNWEWKPHHRICSKHFPDNCYYNFEHKWRRLNPKAVPSLRLVSKVIVRKTNIDCGAEPTPNSISMPSGESQNPLAHRVIKLERDVTKYKNIAKQRLLMVNALRQMIVRLKKKNTALQDRLMAILTNKLIETEVDDHIP